jgi:hypothetical protein
MLCETCLAIDFKPLDEWDNNLSQIIAKSEDFAFENQIYWAYYLHKNSLKELEQSSRGGCHFCAVLWHSFAQIPESWKPPDSWGVSPMELDIAVDYPIAIGMRREGLKDWRDGAVPQGVARTIEVYYGPHQAVLEIVSNLSSMIPTQIPASSREYSP